MEKKYYFVSFVGRMRGMEIVEDAVIDEHPLIWRKKLDKANPFCHYIIQNWIEISKDVYDIYIKGGDTI